MILVKKKLLFLVPEKKLKQKSVVSTTHLISKTVFLRKGTTQLIETEKFIRETFEYGATLRKFLSTPKYT